jgi:hypothetical protein
MSRPDPLSASVIAVLRRAAEMYEADPRSGLQGQPFIFTLEGESGEKVVPHPVVVQVDPSALIMASSYGPKALEALALDSVRGMARGVPLGQLAAVGYLFPATGDFPQSEADASTAAWLRSQKAPTTPWEQEGVVMVLDLPDGRITYGALRTKGEMADPLSEPKPMVIFASHVPRLYPGDPGDFTPPGGFC